MRQRWIKVSLNLSHVHMVKVGRLVKAHIAEFDMYPETVMLRVLKALVIAVGILWIVLIVMPHGKPQGVLEPADCSAVVVISWSGTNRPHT